MPQEKSEDTKKTEEKVYVEMTERVRWPIKKGSKKEYLTLHVGDIIKCSKEIAADMLKEKLAKDYDPEKLKVIEL